MTPDTKDNPNDDSGGAPFAQAMAPADAVEWAAAVLAVVWTGAVAAHVWTAPEGAGSLGVGSLGAGSLGVVLTLLVVCMPLTLIWAAVTTLRSVRALRAEAARVQAMVEAMHRVYMQVPQAEAQADAQGRGVPAATRKPDEIAAPARQTGTVPATFTSRRDVALTQPSADRKAALVSPMAARMSEDEPSLALGTPAEALRAPLAVADFIRALQFPENTEDRAGFRALRLALEDRRTAKLIRAAQDVLTLLSQQGIYMDDLKPDRARPEVWRRFATGERGRTIAALGGVRDRSSLALTAGRMREDTVFRDAGHHFLRSFDKTFAAFEPNASDEELVALADTRTARAFMLFGRVTGTFD